SELIEAGRVRLNGALRRDPEVPVRLGKDRIAVDGMPVESAQKVYLMVNKPRGLVTTASDEKGRDTIYSVLDPKLPWLAPVGRLDKASEGLLLLTNDSEWAAQVAAPETHLEKTYHVQINRVVDAVFLRSLITGIKSEGDLLRAVAARLVRSGEKNCWIEIKLEEGKNRQIRRLMEALGVEVLRLIRVAIGPLVLGDLPKRAYRPLTQEEKMRVDRAMTRRRNP